MKIKGSLSSFDLFDLCVTFKRVKLSSNRPKMFKMYLTYVLCRKFSFYTSCNSLGVFALRGDPSRGNWVLSDFGSFSVSPPQSTVNEPFKFWSVRATSDDMVRPQTEKQRCGLDL